MIAPVPVHCFSITFLEYRRDSADLIQVYKIIHGIDKIDKDKMFTLSRYRATCGHSLKLYKKRARLKVRANIFSNRVVDNWNSLTEDIVNAPSLNAFKSRLNWFWYGHPNKFSPACYAPGKVPETGESRTRMHKKRPTDLIICRHRYIRYIKGIHLVFHREQY